MINIRTSLRPMAFGLAAIIAAGAATTAQACPDWSLTGAQISYDADTLWVPQSVGVVAGGNVNLTNCPQPGHGWVITQPDFDLSFTDNSAQRDLEFRVTAGCDTVLLVNDASGNWHFDDDSGGNLNPSLRIARAPAGAYDIWVGTFGQATCQATLTLETFGGSYAPGGSATPQPPQPMADPGNMVSYRQYGGQTFSFNVTGATGGSVWGSGIYTDDSSVATAAVHAGVLAPGQSGVVQVQVMPGQQSYQGSTAYGVQSSNYGSWSGSYSFVGYTPIPTAPSYPADPGNLTNYRQQVGQTLTFTVTGATGGSVWGSGIYTDDSSLAAAAVHAGVLQPGQTGPVQVTILPGQQSYTGSTAYGVQSSNYGSWSGSYSIVGAMAPAAPTAPTAPTAPAGSK